MSQIHPASQDSFFHMATISGRPTAVMITFALLTCMLWLKTLQIKEMPEIRMRRKADLDGELLGHETSTPKHAKPPPIIHLEAASALAVHKAGPNT